MQGNLKEDVGRINIPSPVCRRSIVLLIVLLFPYLEKYFKNNSGIITLSVLKPCADKDPACVKSIALCEKEQHLNTIIKTCAATYTFC